MIACSNSGNVYNKLYIGSEPLNKGRKLESIFERKVVAYRTSESVHVFIELERVHVSFIFVHCMYIHYNYNVCTCGTRYGAATYVRIRTVKH